MSDRTAITWTDATWNPIRARGELGRHFCLKISDGCTNCYASSFTRRLGGQPYSDANSWSIAGAEEAVRRSDIYIDQQALALPLKWKRPRRIFVGSMTDVCGEWVPDAWLDAILAIPLLAPQHTFQLLTKRPNRLLAWFNGDLDARHASLPPDLGEELEHAIDLIRCRVTVDWPLPNVWLGVTVESDAYAWRAKVLAEIPASVRFVSAEPLLSALPSLDLAGIDWLIAGGESGPQRRELHLAWLTDLVDRAHSAGVAVFTKQDSGLYPGRQGRIPDPYWRHEFPGAREEVSA